MRRKPRGTAVMKIATFNVNSIRKRLGIVVECLERHRPDVLCLQETKVQDTEFPALPFVEAGYHVVFRGMKGYNGVATLTRIPADEVTFGFHRGKDADDVRLLRVVINGVSIINTYVPQGYEIESPKYQYKLKWFKRLRAYFTKYLSPDRPAIWLGDMNVAPRPIDVHSPEKHLKHVCYHEAARKAYQQAAAWGFEDVFVRLYPERQQYTFWDYRRPSSVEANKGWRIDHILATAPLAACCKQVEVDVAPRRRQDASDHTILWADFAL